MFGNKNKKAVELGLAEITNRVRGFVLDSQIDNAHELSVILGCSAISEEVQEREEQESDKRVEKINYLIPMIYAHAHALAEASVEFQKSNVTKELKDIPDEIWWESRKMMEQISMAALVGSISQLVDMGLIEIPKKRKK
jgi:hypothetical protein